MRKTIDTIKIRKNGRLQSDHVRPLPPLSIINFLLYKSLYSHSRGAKKFATVFGYKYSSIIYVS